MPPPPPSRPMPPPIVWLALSVAAAIGLNFAAPAIDPYFLDILTNIGINVILAVSLNLVNGYTGQFSLGHAGFMSVGAYASAAITLFVGPSLLGPSGGSVAAQNGLFLGALLLGGLGAALAGLLVG